MGEVPTSSERGAFWFAILARAFALASTGVFMAVAARTSMSWWSVTALVVSAGAYVSLPVVLMKRASRFIARVAESHPDVVVSHQGIPGHLSGELMVQAVASDPRVLGDPELSSEAVRSAGGTRLIRSGVG